MPSKRISFTDFNRRLVVAGGREQMAAPNGLRRASGVAQELTQSVLSRWGSVSLYPINATQLYYWSGHRYQYDGANLYRDGVSIKAGFNGGRLSFNSMPPQAGLEDYLFILGGGVTPFKIDPLGNISNWGIVAPDNSLQVNNIANDQIVIDNFNASAASWNVRTRCSVSDDTTDPIVGSGSLKITPSAAAWRIYRSVATLNLGTYSNGDISLPTDIFQIWVQYQIAGGTTFFLNFDVNDGTFKDYYQIVFDLIPPGITNRIPPTAAPADVVLILQTGEWRQITWTKSQMRRIGSNLQYDWSSVNRLRIGGSGATGFVLIDNWTQSGGSAMGAGPAAGNGGSEYDYSVVYRNLTTGSQSNGQDNPSKVFGVSVNKTQLSDIPVSSDPQVGARDLYRTSALNQAGGGTAFYLDTIYDNTTTTYTDQISDFSVPEAVTPWQPSVNVPPNPAAPYYIDAGNGYYFKLTVAGTTGATPPQWKIPSAVWSALSAFLLNETTSQPRANGHFWKVTTAGTSGIVEPDWTQPGPLTDGTIVWTDQGLQVTADNSVQWTFQGINSTRTLGVQTLLFDNAPPLITYGIAFGPFEGSMLWTRDSAAGKEGYVYMSPPGRPEGVGLAILVGSTNDPMQTVVGWDARIWALSSSRAFKSNGSYPAVAFLPIDDALGTLSPYTVTPVQLIGIIYWAPDGIRILNWSGSKLIGFQALAPIFRGQPEEDLPAWNQSNGPVWAEHGRNEIIFSDGATMTLALLYDGLMGDGPVWRQPGRIMTAAYYEHQTGELAVAFGGAVYLFEHPGALSDG